MTNIIWIESCRSTNSELAEKSAGLTHGTALATVTQIAGRGQRGNSWESEPGKNLTFSLMLKPEEVRADMQFFISEAVALGITDTLRPLIPDEELRIKWPNDIYAGNKKICGILIENSLCGSNISRSIAGIGININQEIFLSGAPNPVSLRQLTGNKYDLHQLLEDTVSSIMKRYDMIADRRDILHRDYVSSLYGLKGLNYKDSSTGDEFFAVIEHIAPTGHITLKEPSGALHTYAFKEVTAIISS